MTKTETTTKATFNWSALRTKILIVSIVAPVAFIAGYFYSINLHTDARADVVSDMKIVVPVTSPKESK